MSCLAVAISHHPSQGHWPTLCWVSFRKSQSLMWGCDLWVLCKWWEGALWKTFSCLHTTPNNWKNKAESSHAYSLTTGHLYTSTVIFLPTIIWCVDLPSSPNQTDLTAHKGICSLISCPFHPEQVLTLVRTFLKINSSVSFPIWIVTGSHPRYLVFFLQPLPCFLTINLHTNSGLPTLQVSQLPTSGMFPFPGDCCRAPLSVGGCRMVVWERAGWNSVLL